MSEGIVDIFKTIKVEKYQRNTLSMTSRLGKCIFQPVLKQFAIRQSCQRIVVGKIMQLLAYVLLGTDIRKDGHIMSNVAFIITNRIDIEPLWIDLAILAPIPDLSLPLSNTIYAVPHRRIERFFLAVGI